MTVSTESYRIQYSGDGSTVAFATDFEFIANGDLVVVLTDSDGLDTTQTITTNYTVTGAGNDAGGTVTMVTAPASGEVLTIYRDTAKTQGTDYTAYDTFPEEAHEQALDKLTLIAQENAGAIDRSLKFKVTEDRSGGTKNSDVPSPETGKALGWDANGNLANVTLSSASTETDVDALILTGDKGKALRASTTEDGYVIMADAGTLTGTDTLTASVGLDGYNSNQVFTLKAANTNTGAVTLNLDSLGAKSVTLADGTALVAGDMVAGELYSFWYDGTKFILINPSGRNGIGERFRTINADVTYQIGSGQDYETVNDALEELAHRAPEYLSTRVRVTLNLASGFTMAEQVFVDGLSLGWISITGTDATTTVTSSAISTADPVLGLYPVFCGTNGAVLPVIAQKFSLDGSASGKSGMALYDGSTAHILNSKGITNYHTWGAYVRSGSNLIAESTDMSSTTGTGLFCYASTASVAGASFAGTTTSLNIQNGSRVNADSVDVTGTGGTGISCAKNSTVDANGADATGRTTGYGIATGSIINAGSATGALSTTANTVTSAGIIFQ